MIAQVLFDFPPSPSSKILRSGRWSRRFHHTSLFSFEQKCFESKDDHSFQTQPIKTCSSNFNRFASINRGRRRPVQPPGNPKKNLSFLLGMVSTLLGHSHVYLIHVVERDSPYTYVPTNPSILLCT